MELTFGKITEFERGTLYSLLKDAYSFDDRYQKAFDRDWLTFDQFFYDNPCIAENFGFMTVLNGEPIGHISWDPRKRPEYVQIGHNCIAARYKGKGYGKLQLREAVDRIKAYPDLRRIIVETNSNLIAPKNYESVGFRLYDRKENHTEIAFSGDYLEYEILL